ncbi:hypothetical protein [Micromonospora sp. NBC_00617]|uniref:hypothetical protein n=1 Tax=Micromonospora sp. NBC_00617 TaxID=2903587 RepID=UPI0030DEF082
MFDDDPIEVADDRPGYRDRWSASPADDDLLFGDDEPDSTRADIDWLDVGDPVDAAEVADGPDAVPWWVTHGERIEAATLSNRKRERGNRLLGLGAGYPKPFTWNKTADEILDRLASYLQRIPGAGH